MADKKKIEKREKIIHDKFKKKKKGTIVKKGYEVPPPPKSPKKDN
ncbi:hypothetical protein ACFL1Z_02900 [Thermodesulfobacteriota bacterium]